MKKLSERDIQDEDITWILTVPAIWRDSAKQFMRRAATRVRVSKYDF